MSRYFAGYGAPAGAASLGPDDEWSGWSAPPMVTVEQAVPPTRIPEASSPGVMDSIMGALFGKAGPHAGIVPSLVNIFGQRVDSPPPPPPVASTPIWVYLAIPVALLGVVALVRSRRSSRVGGYKRSRRSRR